MTPDTPTTRPTVRSQRRTGRALPAAAPAVRGGLVLSLSAAMLMPAAVLAQTAAPAPAAAADAPLAQLPEVKARAKVIDPNPNAETGVPYKAKTSGDSRHTRPLAETPQTITVLTKSAIDDSGATDLKAILGAQPGITLGTGENGNAFGDRYIIRGQEARSDVFVDGLRDPGMSTRESFAVEQLEISKGPNSSFAGRGTAGGAINAITKQATLDYDFARVSAGVGSDRYLRATADVNKILSDTVALRANLLQGDEDVPGRAPASRKRQGVALSGLVEFSPALQLTLDYYGLRAHDKPDLGGYLVGTAPNRVPDTHAPVYAQTNDFLDSSVDTVTARLQWTLAPQLKLTSLTRFGQTDNGYGSSGASYATRYSPAGVAYSTGVLDAGHTGWQEVRYFAHQSNLRWDTTWAGMKHELIVGLEVTDHQVTSAAGTGQTGYAFTNSNAANCRSSATATANNAWCFTDSSGAALQASSLTGRVYGARSAKQQDWQAKTTALSLMDTVDLTDKLTVFGGLRADHFQLTLDRFSQSTGALTASYGYRDTLVNGHLGVSFKLRPDLMVYASTASAQDINGGEADSGTNSGYGGAVIYNGSIAAAKPETSRNLELGAKWNALDGKLLATAALFRTRKTDVMEGANYDTVGTFNSGGNQVQGLELGVSGNVNDRLSLQAGLAVMTSKITASATAANIGRPLSNFANRSASVQGKYQLTDALALGATVRHESNRCGGQPDTAAGYVAATGDCAQPVPSFTVLDLFGSYRFNKQLDLRVNVGNATNKDYYTAVYRSGSFLYKGDARSVRTTLNYSF
jgi:catecholate siderophore receptor